MVLRESGTRRHRGFDSAFAFHPSIKDVFCMVFTLREETLEFSILHFL